jgi:hypothetical protein
MPETAGHTGPEASRWLLVTALAAGLLFVATVALWVRYGTAVFYEMILAGLAACF